MKKIKFIIILITITFTVPAISYSHSGRTDSNGGHWDYSTGTYHYHNDGSSVINKDYTFAGNDDDDEYINTLREENSNLQDKVSSLQEEINNYKYDLKDSGFNSINDLDNKIDELESKISNMWFWFFIVLIASIIISYNIGFKASDNSKTQQIKQITNESQKLKDYKSTIIALTIVLSFMVIAIIGLLIYISELK